MAVTRRYLCDCGYEWTKLHFDRSDPIPECPMCVAREEESREVRNIPSMFAITGVKSKAIDYAQKMAEEDYGLTDMNDSRYEGDVAAKAPKPAQTAEVEAAVQQLKDASGPGLTDEQAAMAKTFWGGGMASAFGAPPQAAGIVDQQVQAMTGIARATASSDGVDPVGLLHKQAKAGGGRMKLDVVGRSSG